MLNKILEQAEEIAIGGHIRPDGDCVGSCMGMYLYLKENFPEKKVEVYLEEIPESFKFLKDTSILQQEINETKDYDLFICLDCGDKDRLGFSIPLFEKAKHTFCVDHHVSNQEFAEENYVVADASSTSELVYNLLDKEKISLNVAEALYLGIVHDTGVFQYSCASPSTFRVAAELLEKGVDAPTLIQKTFYEKTYAQNQILGQALLDSILFMDGKCIASCIKKSEMDFYHVTSKDLEGIVSQMRNTEGTEVAIFMYELEPNVFKVSLRSGNEVDVSKVAQCFGGGGHKKAAGLTMTGSSHDVLNNLSKEIELQVEKQR